MIRVKRVYESPDESDGFRVLVDRLWPRGMKKERARVDLWLKDIAPSTELRKWYHQHGNEWEEFKHRYFKELEHKHELMQRILELEKEYGTVTLLFSSKEQERNNATALQEYLLALSSKSAD